MAGPASSQIAGWEQKEGCRTPGKALDSGGFVDDRNGQ